MQSLLSACWYTILQPKHLTLLAHPAPLFLPMQLLEHMTLVHTLLSSAQTEMKKKVDKWQEPAPAKQHKVLPVPDMEPKKRRGGRRFRKMKERYGLTDMRKAANRSVYLQSLYVKT